MVEVVERIQRTEFGDWEETPTNPVFDTPEYHLWYEVVKETVKDFKDGKLDPEYLESEDFRTVCTLAGITSPELVKENLNLWESQEFGNYWG